jgi:hypothetical protein
MLTDGSDFEFPEALIAGPTVPSVLPHPGHCRTPYPQR